MSEYRSDEETVEAISEWWKENGAFLVGTIVVVIAGILGWNWWQGHSLAQAEGAASIYLAWQEAPREEADALADRLLDEYPRSGYVALIRFDTARRAVEVGDTVTARSALEEVLELRVSRQLKDLARIRLARLELAEGRAEGALAVLDGVRGDSQLSLVEELRGDAFKALGREQEAVAAYERAMVAAEEPRPLLEIKFENLLGMAGGSE